MNGLQRTANGFPSAAALSAHVKWSSCVGKDGQHFSHGVHKPPRRSASPSLYRWANRLLLWAAVHIRSLRAVHIPGHLNYGADLLSRRDPQAADWCLHPQVVDQIWLRFYRAQVDLFANRQNTCCPLWFSLGGDDPPLGIDALGHHLKGAGS